jgi:hypothetical protein
MHQWVVGLEVRTREGIFRPIIVKVQVEDDLVAGKDYYQLCELIELAAKETVVDPRGNAKLFTSQTAPLEISVLEVMPVGQPVAETNSTRPGLQIRFARELERIGGVE